MAKNTDPRGIPFRLVIDGAHNVTSAEALAQTLKTCFPETPRTLIRAPDW